MSRHIFPVGRVFQRNVKLTLVVKNGCLLMQDTVPNGSTSGGLDTNVDTKAYGPSSSYSSVAQDIVPIQCLLSLFIFPRLQKSLTCCAGSSFCFMNPVLEIH